MADVSSELAVGAERMQRRRGRQSAEVVPEIYRQKGKCRVQKAAKASTLRLKA